MSDQKQPIIFWLFRLVAFLLAISVIGGMEIALRLIRPELISSVERFRLTTQHTENRRFSIIKQPDPDLLWTLKPSSSISEFERLNKYGFRGPDFSIEKSDEVHRIVVLGDSRSFGFGIVNFDDVFTQQIQKFFDSSQVEKKVEVLNLSVIGYTSYQGLRLFEKFGSQLQPDIILIWFGFNDLLYYHVEDRVAAEQKPLITWSKNFLHKFFLYHWMESLWIRVLQSDMRTGKEIPFITERVPPEQFESNLEQLIKIAHRINAKTFILSSAVRADVPMVLNCRIRQDSSGYNLIPQYEIGDYWLMDKTEFPGTEYELDTLIEKNPDIAILRYFKGLKLRERGEFVRAEEAFSLAAKLDETRDSVSQYNSIARHVADKNDVGLIDLFPVFKTYSRFPLFVDDCHPNANGHGLIAARVIESLTGMPSIVTEKPVTWTENEESQRRQE